MFVSLNSILLVISGASAVAYGGYLVHQGPSFWRSFIKTLAVGCLAAHAFADQGASLLFWSLALGAAGDMFLTWRGDQAFRFGVASFALGHLFLASLFLDSGAELRVSLPAVILLVFVAGLALVLFRAARAQKILIVSYSGIIAMMGVLALGLPELHVLALWAAMLFVFSDAVLACELFLLQPNDRARQVSPYVIWATYYVAQLLFFFHFTGAFAA